MLALLLPLAVRQHGSVKDTHGCIPSAGYTWCASKQSCVRIWELPEDEQAGCAPPDDIPADEAANCADGDNTCCWQPKNYSSGPLFDTTYDLSALTLPRGQWYTANSSALYHNDTAEEEYTYLFNICSELTMPKDAPVKSPGCQTKFNEMKTMEPPSAAIWQIGQPGICPQGWAERYCFAQGKAHACMCVASGSTEDDAKQAAQQGICKTDFADDDKGSGDDAAEPGVVATFCTDMWQNGSYDSRYWDNTCYSLGEEGDALEPKKKFKLLDSANPAAGVVVTYFGEDCGDRGHRQFDFHLHCSPDDEFDDDLSYVEEYEVCRYRLAIKTPKACPQECKIGSNGLLCSGRGRCTYNALELQSMCLCDPGMGGDDCGAQGGASCGPGTVFDATSGQCVVAGDNAGIVAGGVIGGLVAVSAIGWVLTRKSRLQRAQERKQAESNVDLQAQYSAL